MAENIIEFLRKRTIDDLFTTNTVANNWDIWKNSICNFLPNPLNYQNVLSLGDHLSEIFASTGQGGREQGSLSGGGAGWEALIVWYINLCCAGSRVVAIKKIGQVPQPIRDSITVSYNNFSCSTESDITIIIFPNLPKYTSADSLDTFFENGRLKQAELNNEVDTDFLSFKVGIIQCKTNWNDNAQIPMLWDMIYSAGGFGNRQISVGINGFSIQNLPADSFTYSFVTVPSNNINQYKPNSVSVRRVTGLSGGNYWGRVTSQGIAKSVKEIFNNYSSGFNQGGIRTHINSSITLLEDGQSLDYFRIY